MRSPRITPAFTLIEVLVSLALTGLLVTFIGQVAVQAILSERRVDHITQTAERSSILFDALEDDLSGRSALPSQEQTLTLSASEPQMLTFHSLVPGSGDFDSLHQRRLPQQVTYQLQRQDSKQSWSLVRIIQNLTDAKTKATRETLAMGMQRCQWEIYDGKSWQRSYPPLVRQPRKPVLLRMQCHWSGETSSEVRTYMLRDLSFSEAPPP